MLNNILSAQTLYMENVLIYRNKVTQEESDLLTNKISSVLTESGACQAGPTATVTHSVQIENGQPVFDLEFIIPLNKEIVAPNDFSFQPKLKIENTLKMHLCGNPQNLNTAMEELKSYIEANKLTPVTPVYTVTVKAAQTQEELDNIIIDIYVGV